VLDGLVRRLAALPEPAMRRVVLAESLSAMQADEAVAVLAGLVDEARRVPRPPWTVALAALAHALGDANLLAYDVRASIYGAAKECGRDEIAAMFLRSDPKPAAPEGERVIAPQGRALTLGERKWLARSHRRDLLVQLLKDPHRAVIEQLLGNPRLVERDVVALAARRPVAGDILVAIFESKWFKRYHVRRALLLNPYLPVDVAMKILPAMPDHDLKDVARDSALAGDLRKLADALLAR
jgi:hypothetical protein